MAAVHWDTTDDGGGADISSSSHLELLLSFEQGRFHKTDFTNEAGQRSHAWFTLALNKTI